MDTTTAIAFAVLVISTSLLAVISAAEAAVGAISRSRLRDSGHGLHSLLDSYIHQRQQVLRALNAGGSLVMVTMTIALVVLAVEPRRVGVSAIAVAAVLALLLSTTVRQCARVVALVNPERTGLILRRPIRTLQMLLGPVAWTVGTPARALVRLAGWDPNDAEVDPAGELLAVLEHSTLDLADGQGLTEERRMMRGILAMSEQTVREVMSPRPDIVAISASATLDDAVQLITNTGFSRIPLYEESIDRVVAVVYAKDLLAYLRSSQTQPTLREVARPPYFVPESKRVDDLLSDMRRDQVHMAIAVDEYGGTAGLVTVEDLLEEIVGEIADEYDVEDLDVQRVSDDEAVVDARLPIDDLNDLFGTDIDSEDFDTVGGLVLSLLGRLAVPGDVVTSADETLTLRVLSILGRRIKKVRVTRIAPKEPPSGAK